VLSNYQVSVDNLIMYLYYGTLQSFMPPPAVFPTYDPSYMPSISNNYDPLNPVMLTSNAVYYPTENYKGWFTGAFYDLNNVYTGTFSSGYYINNIRYQPTSNNFSKESSSEEETYDLPYEKLLRTELAKEFKMGVGPSTKIATVSTLQQKTAVVQTQIPLSGGNATQTIQSILSTSRGRQTTTVASNVNKNGTNNSTINNVSRGIAIP
jgi:hypothetical protein